MQLDQKKIGKAIAHLRKEAGFTQKGLADRLFISDKAVSKWERGLSIPDIAYLGKLSVLLDVDIEMLLEGKSVPRANNWKGFLYTGESGPEVSLITNIYDKPMVYYLLSNFMLVGIREVLLACTETEEESLRELFENGEPLGMKLTYFRREPWTEIRDAIHANVEFFEQGNIFTIFENCVLYGASLTYLLQRAMLNHGQHTILAVPAVEAPENRCVSFDENRRVCSGNAVTTKYSYSYLPVLFSPGEFLIRDVPRGMAPDQLVTTLADKGNLFLETANRGILALTVASVEDALEASSVVNILQKRTGVYVGCLEEIAWRRGMIDHQKLADAAQAYHNSKYGKYLLKLK